jgi:asparagine synthase (glutamine-hydrolysing)
VYESGPAAVTEVADLLARSVHGQLEADVPLGVLLSGGIDSSSIAALAAPSLRARGLAMRTWAVDIEPTETKTTGSEIHDQKDGYFAAIVAAHVRSSHEAIKQGAWLANPDNRQAVINAYDLPCGFGDIDISMFRFFKEIRKQCTVALSGEGADELFGGYSWMQKSATVRAHQFPWLASPRSRWMATQPFYSREILSAAEGRDYLTQRYYDAIEQLSLDTRGGDVSPFESRMRELSYLHLTRFLPGLLNRKDRLSMANGLEIRVPFCDHRLVEYVFSTTWNTKRMAHASTAHEPHAGNGKELLRAAVGSLLPAVVLRRPKSHYPSSESAGYLDALSRQITAIVSQPGHPVWDLFDRSDVRTAMCPLREGPEHVAAERLLDFALWLETYRPRFSN